VIVKLAFFYESGSFISVVIYAFATASAADISSYTTTNITITTSTIDNLLLLQIMMLGMRPGLDCYTDVKFDFVYNRDI
jgi:hypothetical protein